MAWNDIYGNNVSDKRLKENIKPLAYGCGTIKKLNTLRYNFIADAEEKPHPGFIAQDVEAVIPEIVSTGTDANKTKAVDYIGIVPVLVKAMQEQQQLLEAEKDKNKKLRNRCIR